MISKTISNLILFSFYFYIYRYSDAMFKAHFRLRRSSVEKLCQSLKDSQHLAKKNQGNFTIIPLFIIIIFAF